MPDEKKSPGMLGLLRDVISITGTFDRQHSVYAQLFGNGRIFSIIRKMIDKYRCYVLENFLARSMSITYMQISFAPCSV
jgi:hypothetical protein